MSHTLEHIDYMDALQPTLQEIARVIRPGGVLKCSVPDLASLCQMFLNLQGDDTNACASAGEDPNDRKQFKQPFRLRCGNHTKQWLSTSYQHADIQDPILPVMRMQVMRMIFGGQMDPFDHHRVGFDFCILRGFLLAAGFSSVHRVDQIDEVL
jgi:predicted SAM-dependent methyltransferase